MLTSLVWALATHRDANPFGDAHVQPAPPPPPPATVGGCNVVDTVNAKLGFTLDLTEYTRASWSPQLQQINSYQPADQLFCLSATYDLSVGLFGPYVTVSNKATGPDLIDTPNDPFPLCARLANGLLRSDKLSVAPCFLPSFLGGPYWVAHLEMDEAGHCAPLLPSSSSSPPPLRLLSPPGQCAPNDKQSLHDPRRRDRHCGCGRGRAADRQGAGRAPQPSPPRSTRERERPLTHA